MSPAPTPTQRLADHILDEPLSERVARDRAAGKAWRRIALDLYVETGGQVDVTHETLRSWFGDTERAAS